MSRVAVGQFDALFQLGLADILKRDQVDFVDLQRGGISAYLRRALPDVILLNSTSTTANRLVEGIVNDYPTVRVITCSPVDQTMKVYPAFHHGESYTCPLEPAEIGRQVHG